MSIHITFYLPSCSQGHMHSHTAGSPYPILCQCVNEQWITEWDVDNWSRSYFNVLVNIWLMGRPDFNQIQVTKYLCYAVSAISASRVQVVEIGP